MNLLRASLLAATASLAVGLTACGSGADAASSGAEADSTGPAPAAAAPSVDPTQVMNDVWSSHDYDYLPWQYAPDGCFDRSYYLSMELASRGIPVREQVINVRWNHDTATNEAELQPVDQSGQPVDYPAGSGNVVKWQYHIAAVLMPGPNVNISEPMILDRALEPGPVGVDQWIHDANSTHLPKAPAANAPVTKDDNGLATRGYDEFKTRGAPYVGIGSFLTGNWASFEDDPDLMPTFSASTVQIACNTLWSIWVDCIGADEASTTTMLGTKTNALLTALTAKNALTDWDGQPLTCGRNTSFSCGSHAAHPAAPTTSDAQASDATE